MSIEKLTKRLQGSIDFALDNEEDLDSASWNYQEGILITVNEAKLLLDLVKNCFQKEAIDEMSDEDFASYCKCLRDHNLFEEIANNCPMCDKRIN